VRKKSKPVGQLDGIHRVKKTMANGSIKIYLYHRATGLPLDKDNLAVSYAAAEKTLRRASEETLAKLIRTFDSSTYFEGLSEDTRGEYVWKLKRIEQEWGDCPVSTFMDSDDALDFRKDALAWHDNLGKTSRRSADNLMSALARVLSYAKEKSIIKFNPVDTFKRLYKSDRSELTWSEDLQQQFIATARPAMVTAMILVRNTAMRAGAVRKFAWSRYNGEKVHVWSTKSGKWVWIPATRELKAHLDGLTRKGPLVMLTTTGKGYTKRYFNEQWREDCDKVDAINAKAANGGEFTKTADLNFHDNRGTAATLLAEAGATVPEIAEILVWSVEKTQRIVDTYLARRGVLAASGIAKLEDHRDKLASQTAANAAPTRTAGERKL
jgi:integrase